MIERRCANSSDCFVLGLRLSIIIKEIAMNKMTFMSFPAANLFVWLGRRCFDRHYNFLGVNLDFYLFLFAIVNVGVIMWLTWRVAKLQTENSES
jgi:hypothetical protein